MEEAITRLKLAAAAGADVCFIEGVKTKELLEKTVTELAPTPVCDILSQYHWSWYQRLSRSWSM